MGTIFTLALHNPLILGAVTSWLMGEVHEVLIRFDKTEMAAKYKDKFRMAFVVLSFLASVCAAGSTGQLENVDLTTLGNFLQTWLSVALGAKAMSVPLKK